MLVHYINSVTTQLVLSKVKFESGKHCSGDAIGKGQDAEIQLIGKGVSII